jgi:Zn-dependent peptidase ImmA (M78 family)/DNA-binding XRE family transcriptional regulator
MAESFEAIPVKELLTWARKSSRLTIQEAAKKAQVKDERLSSWENGDSNPTMAQLRSLGQIYKRPIAVFYLPEPPKDFTPLHDFRRLADYETGLLSPALTLEIRRARDRREIALDLYRDLNYEVKKIPSKIDLHDDPESLALNIRKSFRINRDMQLGFADEDESMTFWRSSIENKGILVFTAYNVEVSEMRGFSFSITPLPAIVLNNKDADRGKLFTLIHEYVHILLREGGLCDLSEDSNQPENRKVEIFCNRLAGEILVPTEPLLLEEEVLNKKLGDEWTQEEISKLANKYKVSREVIIRRLLLCNLINAQFYKKMREKLQEEYVLFSAHKKEGFAPPDVLALSRAGKPFARLVLDGYHEKKISASDVSDFLDVKLKHLDKIKDRLFR